MRSRRGNIFALGQALAAGACALAAAACSGSDSANSSYQAAAIEASQNGDQKTAVELAKKEVAKYSPPDQCSAGVRLNCGTLALAYGSLSEYQILDGDPAAGEASFRSAKEAISLMPADLRPSAIGVVYRDVSEAFWKTGDKQRAIAVFREGRAAGGDSWLYAGSAAAADKPAAGP